jgi:hypothetical protein
VKKWAREADRTEDVPAHQASWLINGALKLVLDGVADKIIDLTKGGIDAQGNMLDQKGLTDVNRRLIRLGFSAIGPHFKATRWTRSTAVSVSKFIYGIIPASARIIKAAFSGRRDEELDSLLCNCIHTDPTGDAWLECVIVKNVNSVDRIPVPKSIHRAVEIVAKIRNLVKRQTKRLYDFACPITGRPVPFIIADHLDVVRDYFKVPALDDGTAWHFTPHQFRKLFGVTYHWRWAFPNLTALTFHYRHYNPDTTRRYIEMKAAEALRMRDEKEAAAVRKRHLERLTDFNSTKSDFVAWVVTQVAAGVRLGGAFGRRLWTEIDELKKKFLPEMQLVETAQETGSFDAALLTLIESITVQPHPEGHSLCGCGTSAADVLLSKCLLLRKEMTGQSPLAATGPDFEFATDIGCLVCPHRGQLPTMSPYWENETAKATRILSSASDGQRELIGRRIATIAEHA